MRNTPLVSVVIPIYKVEKYLESSVNSIITQTYKNIEIILVNDGSPDKCPQICNNLAYKYNNITVINKENGGLSDARNYGIKKTKGDYILFLDGDDTLTKDSIEGLVKKAIDYEADLVIPDRYNQIYDESSKKELRFHFDKTGFIEDPISFAIEVMIGQGRAWRSTALLYRSTIIKNNNIVFPKGYIAEDIIFNLSIMLESRKIAFYKKSTLNYLKRKGSITNSFQENINDVYLFIDKNIEHFLRKADQYNEYGNNKRKQLLCRNAILYISTVYSNKNNWNKNKRLNKVEDFMQNKRIEKAFKIDSIEPYFHNKLIVAYFKIMFKLIKEGKRNSAYNLAKIRGIFS